MILVMKAEFIKFRRSPIWLAFFLIPLLGAVMGTGNYLGNIGILQNAWYSLWTQHALFISNFFLPVLLGLFCAYQWRLEHLGTNWNLLLTMPLSPMQVFCGKLFTGYLFSGLTLAWIGTLYFICGKLCGLSGVPVELPYWLFFGLFGTLAVVTIQSLLSMIIKSFSAPVGIALVGGIAGLIFSAQNLWYLCPYGLISFGLQATDAGVLSASQMSLHLISTIIFVLAGVFIACMVLKHKDVDTKTG